MNSFQEDLLTVLKKLKYKYDSGFFNKKVEEDYDYPYFRIHFDEEEIKQLNIDINSLGLLRYNIHKLLEIPYDEIVGNHYTIIGEPDEYDKMIKEKETLIFTISPNINSAIKTVEKNQSFSTKFDEERSELIIKGVPFLLSRKSDLSNVHYIFKYIFSKDPKEEHFYSYMEEAKILGDPKKPETYYKALNTVKEKIRNEMYINDFFEKISTGNSGSVKINNKYL